MGKPQIRQIRITLLPSGVTGIVYGVVEERSDGTRRNLHLIVRGYLEGLPLPTERADLAVTLARLAGLLRGEADPAPPAGTPPGGAGSAPLEGPRGGALAATDCGSLPSRSGGQPHRQTRGGAASAVLDQ